MLILFSFLYSVFPVYTGHKIVIVIIIHAISSQP